MVQIFINEVELDLPANIGEQIAINFEAFPLGEFRNTFNNFSGNLTFPPTPKNREVFGQATNNLSPLTITRQYTGQILSGAIELFYGRVDFERYNNGFECRFVTSGQLLSEQIKQYDMYEIMQGLGRADIGIDQWFDHKYLSVYTRFGVGDKVESYKNVRYPLLDLGYFNNTNNKIGYFDLRASFNLWTMCLAIAKKIDKSLTFQGALPERLQKTYITPKDWKYSDRLIQVNSLRLNTTGVVQTFSAIAPVDPPLLEAEGYIKLNLTEIQTGEFTITSVTSATPPTVGRTTYTINPKYTFFTKIQFKYLVTLRAKQVKYSGEVSRNGIRLIVDPLLVINGIIQVPTLQLLPNWVAGAYSGNTAGIEPTLAYTFGATRLLANANQTGFGYQSTEDIYIQFIASYSYEQLQTETDEIQLIETRLSAGLLRATASGQGDWELDVTISALTNENVVTVTHDERIYPRGIISGADLMGSLKPADILKYAMRLTGSYLVENDTSLTLVPFSDYDKATAMDWSGKVNWLIPPIVDYRDNELGKNNYLIYKQDDTNTPLDPYYLAGNLPTNLGEKDVTLYEAPFAQSAFNQTFQGTLSLVRVPYYDALLAYVYKVWINDSTSFTKGQYVGYEGRLFKILNNVLGSAGTPLTLTNDYEEVDFSVFNNQSPEFRAIEVLTDQVTGVQVYDNLLDSFYTKQDVGALNGIDFQKAITDGYGFIPSTFLDYRQVVCQVSLSDLDIHLLDLKKLVFISELNAYFYINKVEDYTPDTNVDTTVTLTMLP